VLRAADPSGCGALGRSTLDEDRMAKDSLTEYAALEDPAAGGHGVGVAFAVTGGVSTPQMRRSTATAAACSSK
jgi:hypothetical protein